MISVINENGTCSLTLEEFGFPHFILYEFEKGKDYSAYYKDLNTNKFTITIGKRSITTPVDVEFFFATISIVFHDKSFFKFEETSIKSEEHAVAKVVGKLKFLEFAVKSITKDIGDLYD